MNSNLSRNIFIGLFSGIFVGLFLGEFAEPLGFIGDAFIGLMQMTVMPYIMISLLSNLGKVDLSSQKKLILSAMAVLGVFLAIGLTAIFILPVFFPTWTSSSFFSTSLISVREPLDLISIYIPANIFGSLSENVVPAVVLFSIIVGTALNTIPNNEKLINALDVLSDALNKANKYIVKLTPYGIFGIAAHTTAVLSLSELGLVQVYIVIYLVAVIVLGFVLLPLIVTAVTPFKYKDLMQIPRSSLITIFATGKIIILLPQLIENIKELFKKYGHEGEDIDSSAELLMPLAYPFPNLGTLVIMVFVPFAAWFGGRELSLQDEFAFLGSVLMSSFVAPITGIPFLMDMLKLPHDIFQLFIVSTAFTDRIRVVLGAIHLFSLSIIAIAYAKGLFKIKWRKLILAFTLAGGLSMAVLYPIKLLIGDSFQESFDTYDSFISMNISVDRMPESFPDSVVSYYPKSIESIKRNGKIRVGYVNDALPYVFRNDQGQKVGYDAELMHVFAEELGVKIEWVHVPRSKVLKYINQGYLDLFLSGVPIMADRMDQLTYSEAYSEMNLALLVPDHDRELFNTKDDIVKYDQGVFGTNQTEYLQHLLKREFPNITIQHIESPRDFLTGKTEATAMFFSAEAGSAWTLVYPGYSVIKPADLDVRLPVAMIIANDAPELEKYINQWIALKKFDGTMDRLYKSWILGEASKVKEEKWSIIRDVLHWVD